MTSPLPLEQVDRRPELLVVELVDVLDPEVGLRRLQVERGVGDVDRVVVGRDLALVTRARVEHRAPGVRRRLDLVGAPHQHVGAAAVRDTVGPAVDRVPGLALQALEHVGVVLHQVGVDGSDVAGGDQAQCRVAGRRDAVVLAGAHQRHHLVGRVRDLDVDPAARLLLEVRHPVDPRVGRAVLHVARPGDQVDLALALADRGRRLLGLRRPDALRAAAALVAAAARAHSEREHGRDRRQLSPHATASYGSMARVWSSRASVPP